MSSAMLHFCLIAAMSSSVYARTVASSGLDRAPVREPEGVDALALGHDLHEAHLPGELVGGLSARVALHPEALLDDHVDHVEGHGGDARTGEDELPLVRHPLRSVAAVGEVVDREL